jgi:flagellar assembly factor FliW
MNPETTTMQQVLTAPRTDAQVDGIPVIEMVRPLAGFPEHRRFALVSLDETGVLCHLRSIDDPELSFVVVPPYPFFPAYAPEVDDTVTTELGVEDESDLLALLVLTLADTPESATANLMAPVLVNHRTRQAGQYVLTDVELPMRAPLSAPDGPAPA